MIFLSQGRPEPGRVMIFFAGPAWGRASHDFFSQGRPGPGRVMFFFAGPAWAGASHDFYFAGPAGLGASHDFYFACEIKIMTLRNKKIMTAGALPHTHAYATFYSRVGSFP